VAHPAFRGLKDVPFYHLSYATGGGKRSHPTISSLLFWAALTDNSCVDSVYVMLEKVEARLISLREVEEVQWMSAKIRPRLIVHGCQDLTGLVLPNHDFMRIKLRSGKAVVLDLSGWQLGFKDWVYTWEDYENKYLAERDPQPLERDEESARHLRVLQSSPEALNLNHGRSQLRKMTDKQLKMFGSKVDLHARRFTD